MSALATGTKAPEFNLKTLDGKSFSLNHELVRGPVVLVFYRGGWCPFCNIHLRGFQKSLADFQSAASGLASKLWACQWR